MTENKRFKIVNDCGDYHLMNGDEQLGYDLCSPAMGKANWNNVVDKLNEQEEYINKLEKEKISLQIKLQKIRDYAEEDGEVKQGVIEKVVISE